MPNHLITLQSSRLVLKTLDENAAELVCTYVNDNRAFLEDWVPRMEEVYYTLEFQKERLKKKIDNGYTFYIFKKSNLNQIIGQVGVSNIVKGAFQSCHLGAGMLGAEINKGYMTEAIQSVIPFVFNEIGLHRIEANVMPKNLRSKRMMEKLGFTDEGLSRKYLKINGKWEDHVRFVLWSD